MSELEKNRPENRNTEILRRKWDEVKRTGLPLPKDTDDKEIHTLFHILDQSTEIFGLVEGVLKGKWETWMYTWNWTDDGRRFKEWIQSLLKRKPESSETLLAYLRVCEEYEEVMVLVDAVRRKKLRAKENR